MELWQRDLQSGFRKAQDLLEFLDLNPEDFPDQDNSEFPLRVPRSFAARMKKGDPTDPLLLQVLPTSAEKITHQAFHYDAVGDLDALKAKGLIQKYRGRVLLIITGACAVHCRYCFRRHFPYSEQQLIGDETKQELFRVLEQDTSIEEVIFSGGDPLLTSDHQLFDWSQQLTRFSHIKRWRIHTRLPSVLPSRITPNLVASLRAFETDGRKLVVVSHINHANEINQEVKTAFELLASARITLLNQSVLLRAINDTPYDLKVLSERLFENGVIPYYLHLLDRTQGITHFEVEDSRAKAIYAELSSQLPGYLLPKLVREIKGQAYKVIFGHSDEVRTS